jgi:glycosyltransferase involved in cell wall biosynthesis
MHQNRVSIAHAFDFYTNLALIPAARWPRIPVVIGSQRQLGDLLTPKQFKAQLWAFHLCDVVICNSRAAADVLVERGLPERKIAVIGNGLPDSAFTGTASILPNRPAGLRVGMVARMNTRSKNHSGLLRAAALLKDKFPATEYVLAGDGPVRAELEKEAADLGIADRVLFLGDRRDIPAVLSSVDVTVLPSFSESLSNSIIESMALGVPVVALRVGGNPELVSEKPGEERGVLVPSGSDEALAGGLAQLLGNSDLRLRMGANARSFALATFTIGSMRQRHEELYAELLRKKGWHPA